MKKVLYGESPTLTQFFFFDCVKLIEYIASAVNVESSNPCVSPSPRIKVSSPLLSICTDELLSATKNDFFPTCYRQVMKCLHENQILYRSRYTCVYLHQHY